LGRDVLSRLLWGGRRTLFVAVVATALALVSGAVVGIFAGTKDKIVGSIMQLVINSLLALPPLIVALVLLTLLEHGMWQMVVALTIGQVAGVAQVTRVATLQTYTQEYLLSAQALGAHWSRIVVRHVLPNLYDTIIAYATVTFAYTILNAAALTFLGVGNEPGEPDWGVMLAEGRRIFSSAPWVSLSAGIAITMTIMAINNLSHRTTTFNVN